MEGNKLIAFLICCLLLKVSLSAPIPTNKDRLQKLEEQVEELTERLKLLKEESHHYTKRQAASNDSVLNENRKFGNLISYSYVAIAIANVSMHV